MLSASLVPTQCRKPRHSHLTENDDCREQVCMWKQLCLTDLDCLEGAHELALYLPNLYTVLATPLSLDLGQRPLLFDEMFVP